MTASAGRRLPWAPSSDKTLPFSPRPLSAGEQSAGDLYVYWSPKNQRRIDVLDVSSLAYALVLEFDPTVAGYVERPCAIQATESIRLSVSFWVSIPKGEDRFVFLAPTPIEASRRSQLQARSDQEIEAIGARSGLRITIVHDADILADQEHIAGLYRLLPFFQQASRITDIDVIMDGVAALAQSCHQVSIGELVRSLSGSRSRVMSAIATFIAMGMLEVSTWEGFGGHSLVAWKES